MEDNSHQPLCTYVRLLPIPTSWAAGHLTATRRAGRAARVVPIFRRQHRLQMKRRRVLTQRAMRQWRYMAARYRGTCLLPLTCGRECKAMQSLTCPIRLQRSTFPSRERAGHLSEVDQMRAAHLLQKVIQVHQNRLNCFRTSQTRIVGCQRTMGRL